MVGFSLSMYYFYPRPPRGGRHAGDLIAAAGHGFLSTPSARRATLITWLLASLMYRFLSTPSARRATFIFIRSGMALLLFLSTPSARRATRFVVKFQADVLISIHALREEGDLEDLIQQLDVPISIHALREEGDAVSAVIPSITDHFYPRPPRGGRRRRC